MADIIVLEEEEQDPQTVAMVLSKKEAVAILAMLGGCSCSCTVTNNIYDQLADYYREDPLYQKWESYIEKEKFPVLAFKE